MIQGAFLLPGVHPLPRAAVLRHLDIAEPVAVVEEVDPVGYAVDPVELKPTFTAVAPTARNKGSTVVLSPPAPTARDGRQPALSPQPDDHAEDGSYRLA